MARRSDATSHPPTPRIAITMGDPLGIGPEIVVKSLADPGLRASARFVVYGIEACLRRTAERAGIELDWLSVGRHEDARVPDAGIVGLVDSPEVAPTASGLASPAPTARGGEASLLFLEGAISAAKLPPDHPLHTGAIVTAPISKTSWTLAGETRYPGHTELLAERFGARRVAMMFVGPSLRVVLVTIHVPLRDVAGLVTVDKVHDAIELGREGCARLGIPSARIAVCGLNPHAGEGGILGSEDEQVIRPAVQAARARGVDAGGPYPADTVFLAAAKGEFDLVVAMYHDQGLIPVKLLDRDRAVNFTVGLSPTGMGGAIRTSPAHGTAFDIAGKNLARADSMRAAIELAVRIAKTEARTE